MGNWIFLDCIEVVLVNYIIVQFFTFGGKHHNVFHSSCTVLINSVQGFHFLHISPKLVIFWVSSKNHPYRCDMMSHFSFDLHFEHILILVFALCSNICCNLRRNFVLIQINSLLHVYSLPLMPNLI